MPDPTAMMEVAAGNLTGIYYITVSNLPFNTQWTDLKDFVRTVCEVDYVEVFNASTHAWVRVLGYEDYCKAFHLLNGGVFKGRHLVADCRNASEKISIRTLVDVGRSAWRQGYAPSSPGPSSGYVPDRSHWCNVEGSYEPLEAGMDGVGLEDYPYGYAGYKCEYPAGGHWRGNPYDRPAESSVQRGHDSKKKKDKGKREEKAKGPAVPVIVDGSSNRRDGKGDKKTKQR